ncbi:MAG: Stp1/IreP family PP2C-type Ser/Thr phosphatase [Acidimicrobiales bacterium]|nr:Stp1/IreP family PP2C-type Ser/Thr phosphatase [Acidimicrobiales bacterium]
MTARADRTTMRWGGATDVGRVRSNNQDQYLARADISLWAVADGMGGHSGGEVASQIACETLGQVFVEHTVDGLIDAVEQANTAVFRTGAEDPELTGMGTTLVALAVVEHEDDEVLAIANVGDSRCYRYSAAELDQVTTDHSLVADLVREGSLSPEEAAVHPQRNIVTRVLGVYDHIPVDVFAVDPQHGDRYVLCSDGLFNEVPEPAIAATLRSRRDPAEAAEELVRLAVEGGGRDNVTVVVVDVVDDGGRSETASAALAAEGDPLSGSGPTRSPAYSDGSGRAGRRTDTAELDLLPALDDPPDADPLDPDEADGPRHKARGKGRKARKASRRAGGRRLTWRVALFTLLLLGLVGGVVATIQWYGTSAYFVGFEGDEVAIFKGRPGGVLWITPELVDVTDVERDRVPESRRDDIDAGIEQASLTDARRFVANVSEQADELDPPTTSTTAPTTTTAPPNVPSTTATTAAAVPPA